MLRIGVGGWRKGGASARASLVTCWSDGIHRSTGIIFDISTHPVLRCRMEKVEWKSRSDLGGVLASHAESGRPSTTIYIIISVYCESLRRSFLPYSSFGICVVFASLYILHQTEIDLSVFLAFSWDKPFFDTAWFVISCTLYFSCKKIVKQYVPG